MEEIHVCCLSGIADMLPVGKKSHGVIGFVCSGEIARVATVCFAMEIPFWIKMISWDVP